jgi:hypothetical protein
VQVSFRRHTLAPEPFLVVGLIAATRRILVITAEFAKANEKGDMFARNSMVELGLLALQVVVLVVSLRLLRQVPVTTDNSYSSDADAGSDVPVSVVSNPGE